MLKLIGLEIAKYRLTDYWKGVVIANLSLFAILIGIFVIENLENELLFLNFEMTMDICLALIRVIFLIFSTVIMVKIIIEEYKNSVIGVMFTYPISRKKIMFSKLVIIAGFTFGTVLTSSILIEGFIYIADAWFDVIPGEISQGQLLSALYSSVLGALASAGISLIPLYFGMLKKSASATFVSSVLLVSVTNTTNNDFSLFSYLAVPISLCLLGILIGYVAVSKIEQVDL